MPESMPESVPEPTIDTIQRLYCAAEALRHLAANLPEDNGGLAFLIGMVGEDVQASARQLDNTGALPG